MIIVIAGAGGVGKGTVARELVKSDARLWLSRSWTTREKRPGEDRDAYRFATSAEFDEAIASNTFLEWAEFQGNRYGTPWPKPDTGDDVVLEIDVQGATQVHEREPNALIVFLIPPSMGELRRRLEGRGDPPDKIAARLAIADEEREKAARIGAIEIVNDTVEDTVTKLLQLIDANRN